MSFIINIFLPYESFSESVKALDNQRLNKQILECSQLLKAIKTGGAWSNHPAARMFRKNTVGLATYGNLAIQEALRRGIKITRPFFQLEGLVGDCFPDWLGNKKLHSGYRSNLLRKGRADAVCAQIKKHLKLRSINSWLKQNNFPEKSGLSLLDINALEGGTRQFSTPRPPNYYLQFKWKEPDNLPYFWPV